MGVFLRRSLGMILAMALVIAGLPVAHAMPAATHHHDMAIEVAHHCDEMAMDAMSSNEDSQPEQAMPCKCLNCSICTANFVAPMLRLAAPERRIIPVTYRIDAPHLAGIAAPIDPGIPILAS